jgi:hypothetical protein
MSGKTKEKEETEIPASLEGSQNKDQSLFLTL